MAGYHLERLWDSGLEVLVLWVALLAVVIAVAAYVVGKVRSKAAQKAPTASQLMSNCRELHSRGQLTDAEFRTIKNTLAAQLQEELKDNGETA